jgi:hypothetical protein
LQGKRGTHRVESKIDSFGLGPSACLAWLDSQTERKQEEEEIEEGRKEKKGKRQDDFVWFKLTKRRDTRFNFCSNQSYLSRNSRNLEKKKYYLSLKGSQFFIQKLSR